MDLLQKALKAPIAHPGNRGRWTGYLPVFDALHLLRGFSVAAAKDWIADEAKIPQGDRRAFEQALYRRCVQLRKMTEAERAVIIARVGGKEGV